MRPPLSVRWVHWTGPRRVLPKIGIVLNQPDTIHHFRDILRYLDPAETDIVLIGPGQKISRSALPPGWNCVEAGELLARGDSYRTLVSTSYLGNAGNWFWARSAPFYIELLGRRNIRMMYSLAAGLWNYGDWNRAYDVVLGFGPYDVQRLAFCENTRVVPVGYPRYDRFFAGSTDRETILAELGCDPRQKTVVWLPTYQSICSIDLHAARVKALDEKYNLIVKPHPSTFTSEPARVRLLEKTGFKHLIRGLYDNLKLFQVADWVLSDYSGTAFGAMYTDRNLLLLDVPDAAAHPQVGPDSPDILIRSTLVHVGHDDPRPLEALLQNEALWRDQEAERRKWRDHFFAPHFGTASRKAAEAILQVHRSDASFAARPARRALFAV